MILKHKDDQEGVDVIKKMSKSEIIENADELLRALADINWPIAGSVSSVLAYHINDIENNVIKVLLGGDLEWKYSLTILILYHSKIKPSDKIMNVLKSQIKSPLIGEEGSEFIEECIDVVEKWEVT
ncbi:MAG: hypothetical protein ACI8ZM_005537 [Crocinitomix sp.]|jgi:hypothetical protein